jgi:hypothetical protein
MNSVEEEQMKKFLSWITVLAILALIGLAILNSIGHLPNPSVEITLISTPTTYFVSGPVVLNAIRNQAKLETVQMVFANDLDITKTWGLEGACRETLTYLGYYTVTAGVDLQLLTEENVKVESSGGPSQTEITITLPPADILHVELDTQRSRVVHNETSIISQICGTRLGEMVMEAQAKIQNIAETSANQKDILKLAQDRASFELQKLLLTMGYTKVTVLYDESYTQQ